MSKNNVQKKKSESSTQIATRIACIILVVLMLLGSVIVIIQSVFGGASVKGEAVVEYETVDESDEDIAELYVTANSVI